MIDAMDATIWVITKGDMASAYAMACDRIRRRSMTSLLPAMYPPAAPNDLVNVPMSRSTERGSTPK